MAPGHHHVHASKPGQIMALTLRYQHTHPEYKRNGVRLPGRMDVRQRYHYTKGVAGILIKDKKLRNMIVENPQVSDVEKARAVAKYFLEKNNYDYNCAKAQIHEISTTINAMHEKAHFRDKEYMDRIAKLDGIPQKDLQEYMSQTSHMAASAVAIIGSYFQMAELII